MIESHKAKSFTNTWVLQVFNMVGTATATFLHAA